MRQTKQIKTKQKKEKLSVQGCSGTGTKKQKKMIFFIYIIFNKN